MKKLVPFAILSIALAACGSPDEPAASASSATIEGLANDYLFDQNNTDVEQKDLLAEISGLSPQDSVLFAKKLRELQGAPKTEDLTYSAPEYMSLLMDDFLNDLALERGVNRFNISREDVADAVRDAFGIDIRGNATMPSEPLPEHPTSTDFGSVSQAVCILPYVACSTASFPFNDTQYNFCSNGTCKIGFANDNVSNSACELVGCDYRVSYATGATRWNRIDGQTAAADCVATAWPTLISSYGGGVTQILYGYGNTTSCGVFTGAYLQSNISIWKP